MQRISFASAFATDAAAKAVPRDACQLTRDAITAYIHQVNRYEERQRESARVMHVMHSAKSSKTSHSCGFFSPTHPPSSLPPTLVKERTGSVGIRGSEVLITRLEVCGCS